MNVSVAGGAQAQASAVWINPDARPMALGATEHPEFRAGIAKACETWLRLGPALAAAFPALEPVRGRLRSPLLPVPGMSSAAAVPGRIFVKADQALPVGAHFLARGAVYDVFLHALTLAGAAGLTGEAQSSAVLFSPAVREVLSGCSLTAAGPVLGRAVAEAARALGMTAEVYLTAAEDACHGAGLAALGARTHIHPGTAREVALAARRAAEGRSHLVDPGAPPFLLGSSTGAAELQAQLWQHCARICKGTPLCLYLSADGGAVLAAAAFAARQLFGANLHCFFAGPGQADGWPEPLKTDASAIGAASRAGAGSNMGLDLSLAQVNGVLGADAAAQHRCAAAAEDAAGLALDGADSAALAAPGILLGTPEGRDYLAGNGLADQMDQAVHVVWATGCAEPVRPPRRADAGVCHAANAVSAQAVNAE